MSRRRGIYRGVYSVLLNDLDFRKLSPQARHALLTMRLSDYVGIACFWRYEPGALAEQTGYSRAELEPILEELQRAKWVRRDGEYLWITNGLRYDPTCSLANPNHRISIMRQLDTLPRIPMLRSFCRYYALPYPRKGPGNSPAEPVDNPVDTPPADGPSRGRHHTFKGSPTHADVSPTRLQGLSDSPSRPLDRSAVPAHQAEHHVNATNSHAPSGGLGIATAMSPPRQPRSPSPSPSPSPKKTESEASPPECALAHEPGTEPEPEPPPPDQPTSPMTELPEPETVAVRLIASAFGIPLEEARRRRAEAIARQVIQPPTPTLSRVKP